MLVFSTLLFFSSSFLTVTAGSAEPPSASALANTTAPTTRQNTCIDPSDPAWRPIPCPTVVSETYQTSSSALKVRVMSAKRAPTPAAGTTSTAQSSQKVIEVDLDCQSGRVFCTKVRNSFEFVNQQLSQVVSVRQPLKVNATIYSFCQVDKLGCDAPLGYRPIGSAGPALLVPLPFTDEENSKRRALFAQALAQQRDLPQHPQYAPYDIFARFSTDASLWFPEDGTPIKPHQTDFRWVALHEIIHGLGFGISSWRDWSVWDQHQARMLTPFPVSDISDYLWDGFTFDGLFFQTAYDTGIVNAVAPQWQTGALKWPLMVKRHLDGFAGNRTRIFASMDEFRQVLGSSLASKRAMNAANLVHRQERGIGFSPDDGGPVILLATGPELSQANAPSLIGHFDYDTYTNTTSFLMTPVVDSGITLEQKWKRVGGNTQSMKLAGGHTERVLRFIGFKAPGPSTTTPNFLRNARVSRVVRAASVDKSALTEEDASVSSASVSTMATRSAVWFAVVAVFCATSAQSLFL